jgi:hypothetical protein
MNVQTQGLRRFAAALVRRKTNCDPLFILSCDKGRLDAGP